MCYCLKELTYCLINLFPKSSVISGRHLSGLILSHLPFLSHRFITQDVGRTSSAVTELVFLTKHVCLPKGLKGLISVSSFRKKFSCQHIPKRLVIFCSDLKYLHLDIILPKCVISVRLICSKTPSLTGLIPFS